MKKRNFIVILLLLIFPVMSFPKESKGHKHKKISPNKQIPAYERPEIKKLNLEAKRATMIELSKRPTSIFGTKDPQFTQIGIDYNEQSNRQKRVVRNRHKRIVKK